jgi:hypothetical protein
MSCRSYTVWRSYNFDHRCTFGTTYIYIWCKIQCDLHTYTHLFHKKMSLIKLRIYFSRYSINGYLFTLSIFHEIKNDLNLPFVATYLELMILPFIYCQLWLDVRQHLKILDRLQSYDFTRLLRFEIVYHSFIKSYVNAICIEVDR